MCQLQIANSSSLEETISEETASAASARSPLKPGGRLNVSGLLLRSPKKTVCSIFVFRPAVAEAADDLELVSTTNDINSQPGSLGGSGVDVDGHDAA